MCQNKRLQFKKNYIIFEKVEEKKIINIKKKDLLDCLKFLKSLNQKKIKKNFIIFNMPQIIANLIRSCRMCSKNYELDQN